MRAILGQQVSVAGATTLAGRLVERFGTRLPPAPDAGRLTHLFPSPALLAAAPVASIGLPRTRAEAIRGLAAAVSADPRFFDPPDGAAGVARGRRAGGGGVAPLAGLCGRRDLDGGVMTVYYTETDSPVGRLMLAGTTDALKVISFERSLRAVPRSPEWVRGEAPFRGALAQLDEYFHGARRHFDLTLEPDGTDFERRVWKALLEIPYGRTISYGELARRIGRPSAARAVGLANGRNPLSIVIPCHRVIGANGSLTGYGGGLENKRWLLEHEGARLTLLPG